MNVKSLSIRIDETLLKKLHSVAAYEGRSANSQILILIRDCVKDFEAEHGAILDADMEECSIPAPRKNRK